MTRPRAALFVDPLAESASGDRLFGEHRYGDYNEPYRHVRRVLAERGVPVHTGDLLLDGTIRADQNVYVTTGVTSRYRALARRDDTILSAFLVHECPIVAPRLFAELYDASEVFRRMYSFADDASLRPFLRGPVSFERAMYAFPRDSVDPEKWARSGRGFLTIINANKLPPLKTNELYTDRMRAVEYFGRFDEIDLFGFGWDGPPYRVGRRVPARLGGLAYRAERTLSRVRPTEALLAAARRAYRGPASSKLDTLSRYTFAICFENMVMEGWVTEKIFDCLVAGTVPVYLGAPDVERWVDPACYIDMRRFDGYEDLRAYLHSLSPAEIEAYREAGRDYLGSEMFRPFSKEAFAELFVELLSEDAGMA